MKAFRMKLSGVLALAGFSIALLAAAPSGATVEGWGNIPDSTTFDAVLKEAAETNRPILLSFYADWCQPCARLDAITFQDKKVLGELEKYIKVQVNSGTEAGSAVGAHYGFSFTPLVVFADSKGEQVNRVFGYLPPAEFLPEIKAANESLEGTRAPMTALQDDLSQAKSGERGNDAKVAMVLGGIACFFFFGGLIHFISNQLRPSRGHHPVGA